MFEIRAVQALFGDSLILAYGQPPKLHYMLIDGGPASVYANALRPELVKIAAAGGTLDLVVLTHADDDHVIGLVELFKELRNQQLRGKPPLIPVEAIWFNSFGFETVMAPSMAHIVIPLPPPAESAGAPTATADPALPQPAQGVAEGMDLRKLLAQLTIPLNQDIPGDLVMLDSAPGPLLFDGLSLTLIGPTKSNLDRLSREWRAWLQKHRPVETPAGVPVAPAIPDLSKPIAPDQSIPNRSSIMFVAEYGGRRVLFTGDGRGSDILRGLIRAGLMTKDGVYHVDVLKVPHHGSARNASRKFFSQVTADTYIFSADGTNGNPDLPTLGWLVQALKEQHRHARLVFTNDTPTVAEMRREFSPTIYNYTVEITPPGQHAYVISL
jgi:hypothetical protein